MATEAVDSDDEYLYGREGQNITTPPPEPEQEEAIPPSTEMAEVVIGDESLHNTMEEGAATPSPDEPGEDTLGDGHTAMVADTPTDSAAPELKPAEGGGLQDSHVPVIQQSPRDTAGDTTANAGASSDEDDNVDSSEDENENVLIKIGEGNQLTTSAAVKLTTDYSLSASYRPSVPSAQISKQLDINAVGKVNGVSIYDYDIDASFDEKPWRKPGADITDYFNYGFTEETWKAYSLKQKQMRQDYKAPPTILEDTINEEIRVIGEKPILKRESELGPLPELPPPMFNPFMHMPPPGMPHMGPMLPPVVGVPQLDPFVLGGVPPPMPMPPPGMHPFQHEPGRDGMFQPPFPPPGGFRDPGLFPDPHMYPDLMQDFMAMEKRNHSRSPSFSPRRRPSLETLSANSFSSDGSHGRPRALMRDDPHRLREYKRRRHSPRDHRHKEHRESRDNRDRERERDRDRERDQRDREKEYRSHERSRHRGQEAVEKHERMRERDARERVVKRLGERGAVTSERESRSRHERKKHREVGGHDGSPSRRRPKKSRHGTDGSPLP